MYRFIESIKIKDGKLYNVEFHNRRMNETRRRFFGAADNLNLSDYIQWKDKRGLVKCRVLYDENIREIQYADYKMPAIHSLKLITGKDIQYDYKSENRAHLENLYEKKENADDILIVKNREITDTYFCNVIFEKNGDFYTPSSYLLNGTKRQYLLEHKKIKEKPITIDHLFDFEKVWLINAMIDLEDEIYVKTENIIR